VVDRLFCPKCFSLDVQPTFSIGESGKANIICRDCEYTGLALEGTLEYIRRLKRFDGL